MWLSYVYTAIYIWIWLTDKNRTGKRDRKQGENRDPVDIDNVAQVC